MHIGVVKFVGQTTFAKGKWIGIELTENMGKNDGNTSLRVQVPVSPPSITKTKQPPPTRDHHPHRDAARHHGWRSLFHVQARLWCVRIVGHLLSRATQAQVQDSSEEEKAAKIQACPEGYRRCRRRHPEAEEGEKEAEVVEPPPLCRGRDRANGKRRRHCDR